MQGMNYIETGFWSGVRYFDGGGKGGTFTKAEWEMNVRWL